MTTANDLAVRRALEAAGVIFIDENGGDGRGGGCASHNEKAISHHSGGSPRACTRSFYPLPSEPIIKCLESKHGIVVAHSSTLAALRRALEAAGIEFTNGDQPGVRLRQIRPKD